MTEAERSELALIAEKKAQLEKVVAMAACPPATPCLSEAIETYEARIREIEASLASQAAAHEVQAAEAVQSRGA